MLAHFLEVPRIVDPLVQEVVYIGETCDRSLRQRWKEFHRSAFDGKKEHSGGVTYHGLFN
jgi:hypothetical protein